MRISTLIFSIIFTLMCNSLWSKSINVILVIDTENAQSEFSKSTRADYDKMKSEFGLMAKEVNYTLEFYEVKGANFNTDYLKMIIGLVESNPEDVLIFYFAGAGSCDADLDTQTRILRMGTDGGDTISTRTIESLLAKKANTLQLLVIDACGTFWDSGLVSSRSGDQQKIYKALLSACGSIKIFSSRCGEYSFGDEKGGYFTNAFIGAIDHFISSPNEKISWYSLLEKAHYLTEERAMMIFRNQHPEYFFSDDFSESCEP